MIRNMNMLAFILKSRFSDHNMAVKGRVMWDNLRVLIEILHKPEETKLLYIIGLDKKNAFHFISRDYLWAVMRVYGFPDCFIHFIYVCI